MKTVIAEKPSVAREIASLLGAETKNEGYFSGNGFFVTWAFGHLVGLAMPDDYGIAGFSKEVLPILPNPFVLTQRRIKQGKEWIPDKNAIRQLKVIKSLFEKSSDIIVATDAGREGELIFRYIYEFVGSNKPFQRLWISSLTEKAIKKGFENLIDGSEFNGLYHAARARSRADWLIGINASQALSVAAGNGIYSLGRVQTPTLALVCKRFLEHQNFVVKPYFQVELLFNKEFISFKSVSKNKWETKKDAQQAWNSIERNGSAEVVNVDSRMVTEQPPLLFDLTCLQKEASKLLNLSADETLKIAQLLYEKQFITYPRTGSRYIPEDVWEEIPKLVNGLGVRKEYAEVITSLKLGRLNKRIVNDLRVTDHHGLLITDKIPSALSAKENAVYHLIASRLLEAVSEVCVKQITDVSLEALHYEFGLRASKIIETGWRAVKGSFDESDSDAHLMELPVLKIGDVLRIKSGSILEKQTKPPALYTEASLLSAMEQAGRDVENLEERAALKEIGIGTPATRATIIETLFSRAYIVRDKKALIPTDKGLEVYQLVKEFKIADIGMTAKWEVALQRIENNEIDDVRFLKEMEEDTLLITKELLDLKFEREKLPHLICPKCKCSSVVIQDKIVKCTDLSCSWIQYRLVCGVTLSIADIESLINSGKTCLIKGMKSKSGKSFEAYIVLDENGKSSFKFVNN
ncbi:topoisomerase C-terminal repeat-containing protein [Flavobacterium sp. xlx-214]|uniref:type IA DNA topoisomerase n=1 Tax=unclassified Flavobacterium TaxID=196869 RepID=UPI0013D3A017|nr:MULTISPECIES: type IA DNA topoisomerase [unclassified Flavobacterium]MBA5791572.1 topoisomerase C-terminal repeat-containing protein [Flavobacterium sp. xlx-221]QMI82821.1 topoisomerase C-terminal repeat-containing protein [Flavobacterium sp. xlx-214]